MRNAGLDEAQAGIKIAGRNINNLRYVDDTTPMAESKGIPKTKKSNSASLTTQNPLTVCITTNCRNVIKRWVYQTTLPIS